MWYGHLRRIEESRLLKRWQNESQKEEGSGEGRNRFLYKKIREYGFQLEDTEGRDKRRNAEGISLCTSIFDIYHNVLSKKCMSTAFTVGETCSIEEIHNINKIRTENVGLYIRNRGCREY